MFQTPLDHQYHPILSHPLGVPGKMDNNLSVEADVQNRHCNRPRKE